VLAGLRLPDVERLGDLTDRERAGLEQLNDPQPARLTECLEDRDLHETNLSARRIPVKEYVR
jgi:hypothetical protein